MKHLRPFKFEKKEAAKRDKLYIYIMYEGGDADTKHPVYDDLNIKFSEYDQHLDEINAELQKYLTLQDILSDHDYKTLGRYEDIKSKYGEVIADMFDNVPHDPQSDYQFKCYISSIKLVGYDNDGDRYETYI